MSVLLALFLVVHGGVHIGYICGPAWPFATGDPWLVSTFGAAPDTVRAVGIALVLVSFFAYLLAALVAIGMPPARLWAPLVVVGSVTSAVALIAFGTVAAVPGLAIDAVLLWAVLVRGWHPRRQTLARRPTLA